MSISQPDSPEGQLPREGVRAGLSLLIFAHLFIIGTGMLGNGVMSSDFEQRLAGALAPYRRLLGMDMSYGFILTGGDALDVNHTIEADLLMPDGSHKKLVLPDPKGADGEAARHWRTLARSMATYVGNDEVEPLLPTGLGESLLNREGAKQATLTVRGHILQDPSASRLGEDPDAPARWRNVYQARVWKSGDNVRIMKLEGSSETAPAARASASGGLPGLLPKAEGK
jgi:hypothetical protein